MPTSVSVSVRRPLLYLAAALSLASPATALECEDSWDDAEIAMQTCNIGIEDNSMCIVLNPIVVDPRSAVYGDFEEPEDRAPIPAALKAIEGGVRDDGRGFTLLKVVTQGLNGEGQATPFTQAVLMIAFGRTKLDYIAPPPPPPAGYLEPNPICLGSMQPGGRGVVTGPDQNEPIDETRAIERFMVLGKSGSGDRILVRLESGTTGWLDERRTYLIDEGNCAGMTKDDLETVENQFQDVYLTPQQVEHAASFQISSAPVTDEEALACAENGFPPSGLLIFSSSETEIVFTVNNVVLILSSSVLIGQYGDHFTVLVLEGEVRAEGLAVPARAGETILIRRGGRPEIVDEPSSRERRYTGWCERLTRLARAAYTYEGELRVPFRRIDFCRWGAGGYAVPPSMLDAPSVLKDDVQPEQRFVPNIINPPLDIPDLRSPRIEQDPQSADPF